VFWLGITVSIFAAKWVGWYQRIRPKPYAIYSCLGWAGAAAIVVATSIVLVQIKEQRKGTMLVSWIFLSLASVIGIGLILRALLPNARDEWEMEKLPARAILPGELRPATLNAFGNIFAWVFLFVFADSRVPFVLIFWSMVLLHFAGWLTLSERCHSDPVALGVIYLVFPSELGRLE
jgi:hypothetical protein